ncbi:hypothetical protein D3C77_613080 [compost metagenome]
MTQQLRRLLPREEVIPGQHGAAALHIEAAGDGWSVLRVHEHMRVLPPQRDRPIVVAAVMHHSSVKRWEFRQVLGG